MKKKLRKAIIGFQLIKMPTYPTKKDTKAEIRAIADNYEDFNNIVFEIGCEVLAKEYLKQMGA